MITGASAGVGRATARVFAKRGWRVGLIARGARGLRGAASEVEAAGGTAAILQADVSDPGQVEQAATEAEERLGAIEVWVNNAMTTVFAPFEEIEPEEFRRATEVTYLGMVWGTREALRRMGPRDRGAIVQVGSALAHRGIPLQSAYCGAKHAAQGFFESVRTELLHEGSGVRMSMVHLPALNTPQFEHSRAKLPMRPQPVPPIYQPELAAKAIAWAADSGEREVYVGAPTWKTIWGGRLAPGFADRYLARTGYESQQTDQPMDGERAGNLFQAVDRDAGAEGEFGHRARRRSPLLWLATHRGAVGAAAAGVLATAAGAAAAVRSR